MEKRVLTGCVKPESPNPVLLFKNCYK